MRSSRLVSCILVLPVVLVVGLLCLVMQAYGIELVRPDRYFVSSDLVRYVAAGVAFLVTVWVVWEFSAGRFLVLVPTAAFAVVFFILVFPGVIVTAPDAGYGPLAAYGYIFSIVAFDLGVIATTAGLRFRPRSEVHSFLSKTDSIRQLDRAHMTWLVITSVAAVLIVTCELGLDRSGMLRGIVSFFRSGAVPDEAQTVRAVRLSMYSGGTSLVEVFSKYLLLLVLPIVAMSLILDGKRFGNRKRTALGYSILVLTALADIGTGQRRLLAYLVFYVAISLSLVGGLSGRVALRYALVLLVAFVLQTITLGRMQGGEGFLTNILMSITRVIERVLLVKGNSTVAVFDYFPSHSPFRYGATIVEKLLGTLSEQMPLAVEMHYYIMGVAGTAGPQAFGEAYVNFGLLGMIIVSAIIGAVVQAVTVFVVRSRIPNSSSIAVLAYISLLFGLIGYSEIMVVKSNGLHVLMFYVIAQTVFVSLVRGSPRSRQLRAGSSV